MIIGSIFTILLLIVIASVVVPNGSLGKFEQKRRAEHPGDIEVERELYHGDIVSIQRALEALLLVTATAFLVATFGWIIGIITALLVALEYGAVARLARLRAIATSGYRKVEPKLFHLIEKYPKVVKYIRVFTPDTQDLVLHSREELQIEAHV